MEETSTINIKNSDGALLKGVKISLNNTIGKLKNGWKPSVFAKCFPSLKANHVSTLEAIRNKMLDLLVEALCADLTSIVEEELAEPLNRLSMLTKNNSNSQDTVAWRPTGLPETDLRVHDVKALQYEKDKLLQSLISSKKKRIQLFELVKTGRNECHHNSMLIDTEMNKRKEILPIIEKTTIKIKLSIEDSHPSEADVDQSHSSWQAGEV